MNSIPVLGIPHFNRPDLLERCIRSIDYPVDNLVIVRNGRIEDFPVAFIVGLRDAIEAHNLDGGEGAINKLTIINHPNSGCAGAWNEIIKLFPAPYWLLSNNDIQFLPGTLKTLAGATVAAADKFVSFFGNHGHSFFTITARGIETVGLFDENIFPAYLEDCDWMYRAALSGVACVTIDYAVAIHGDGALTGSCTIHSDKTLLQKNSRTHAGNFEYYEDKWGGRNGRETFKSPFNDPTWPVWAWKFDPARRATQQW